MSKDFSHKNLQNTAFVNEDLSQASFTASDLRGADFSHADLTGADFTAVRTGITPINTAMIFLAALVVSAFSGYIAMLAGQTIQMMLASPDTKIRAAAVLTGIIIVIFILLSFWRGVGNAVYQLVAPVCLLGLLIAALAYGFGLGTGKGMLYLVLSLVLVVVMFIVGTIARAVAGSLSTNIMFIAVALGGGMFGKSVGGGIGTVILAISCAVISKKALSGAKGFEFLQRIASSVTIRFGTSFRHTQLAETNFSRSRIHNCDFSNADVSITNWGDAEKRNCLFGDKLITEKRSLKKTHVH